MLRGPPVFTQMRNGHVEASTGVWETPSPIPHGQQGAPCMSWTPGKVWLSEDPEQRGRQLVHGIRDSNLEDAISILLQAEVQF